VDAHELRARKDFQLIGRTVPRRDVPAKVNGSAQYAIDVQLPGMVYASSLHAPAHNAQPKVWNPGFQDASYARPKQWNDAEVRPMKGVIDIVALPNGLAVVANHFEDAIAARDALKVTWAEAKADGFDSERALAGYVRIYDDPNAPAIIVEKKGDVAQSNFHDYNVMRMSDLPDEMHVAFVDVDTRPTGLGEIGVPFIAGAISNALFRLTGKRLRHLPFTAERVLETIRHRSFISTSTGCRAGLREEERSKRPPARPSRSPRNDRQVIHPDCREIHQSGPGKRAKSVQRR
jgi:hypothetical protein